MDGRDQPGDVAPFLDLAAALVAAETETDIRRAVALAPAGAEADPFVQRLAAAASARIIADHAAVAAQLRAVLDSVSDCYYALDRDWTITEFSRSAEDYFRLKRSDVIGRNLWDLFPTGRGQAYEEACRAAMDRGERARLEAPSAFQPGHTIEMRTAPMENGISVAITDITERRRAEAELRKQTRQLEAVLEATPAAIWIARDADAALITGNRFARDLFRVADINMSKSNPEAGPAPEHFDIFDSGGALLGGHDFPIHKAAAGETIIGAEQRIRFTDGTERVLVGNAVPLTDRAGNPRGAVAAFADVTEMKRVETELRDLTRSLEQKIAQAVTDREEALSRLHEAQKNEALGQISGGVAHDFNNLLSPIIGSLDLIARRGLADPRNARLIDGAAEAAQRAKTLVQRMLAFARRQPLARSAIDVETMIESLRGLVESSVGSAVRVAVAVAPGLRPAFADRNQLELALLNLAINARDAMPDGGVLTIAAAMDTSSPFVRLSVVDTGTGMDAVTLKRAIEPFFSTKGVGKGTGLGLSMVHGLAAQLGGELRLASTPGMGTSATLLLPVAEDENVAPGRRETASPVLAAACALVVDDDPLVRATTAAMLEDMGYDVVEAASGDEALAFVDGGHTFDWLVTDHLMPGLSGVDLARTVRDLRPATKVIIVSGYADVEAIAADLPRLAKPFTRDELAAELARLA